MGEKGKETDIPYGVPSKPTQDLEMADRDAQIVNLKRQGMSFKAVGEALGVSATTARKGFQRALLRVREPAVTAFRAEQLVRIQVMREVAMDVIDARHVVVQQGHAVALEGEVLEDPMPILQAMDRVMKLDDQEARLLGMYPASRMAVDATVNYRVEGVDVNALR